MNFFHTHISALAKELVAKTLESAFLSEGVRVAEFESKLAETLGIAHPVAVNSGTSALHLGLVLAGVQPGDEVILSAQTFVASGLVVLMCGAKPVFADIERNTGNIDPHSIRRKITSKTKAIMPVHWGGCPCEMDEIQSLADEKGIAVIEDAAHALGARYRGRPVGALSRFTAFSFQAIKHLTTGDGGALCCLGEDDRQEAIRRRWFGIDRLRDTPSELGERQYNLQNVGYKYHMNDLSAALGLGNLPDLPINLTRHREIAARYESELKNVAGIGLLEYPTHCESSWWIFTVLVERRDAFVQALKVHGVPASVVHQRIDRNAVFGGLCQDLENQNFFDHRQIALPIHVGLSDSDVEAVITAVRQGW